MTPSRPPPPPKNVPPTKSTPGWGENRTCDTRRNRAWSSIFTPKGGKPPRRPFLPALFTHHPVYSCLMECWVHAAARNPAGGVSVPPGVERHQGLHRSGHHQPGGLKKPAGFNTTRNRKGTSPKGRRNEHETGHRNVQRHEHPRRATPRPRDGHHRDEQHHAARSATSERSEEDKHHDNATNTRRATTTATHGREERADGRSLIYGPLGGYQDVRRAGWPGYSVPPLPRPRYRSRLGLTVFAVVVGRGLLRCVGLRCWAGRSGG